MRRPKKTRRILDQVPVLTGLGREFALRAQPKGQAAQNQHNHSRIDRIAHGNKDSFEGHFDELADGGDDFLEVHDSTLLMRI